MVCCLLQNKQTDVIDAVMRLSYFYKHESCGQCTPCREGTGWVYDVMTRMREVMCCLPVTVHMRLTVPSSLRWAQCMPVM